MHGRPLHHLVVTRMDTPKPGWTPYVVYTTEILSFLHNRNLIIFTQQGPVVRKPINANPRLKVNRGFNLSP